MGLFDFLFGSQTQSQPQKTATAQSKSSISKTINPFVFVSNHHQRYENGEPVMGLQNCIRTVRLEKNTNGCKGYRLQPGRGYIVKVWNDDLNKPNMSDKPMDLIKQTENRWEFRGFPIEAQSPFGWQEIDYSAYGFIVFLKNGEVEKCQLHMYDRNTYIEYLKVIVQKENKLYTDANNALMAFYSRKYADLEKYGMDIYNHFVHHPAEILNLEKPLMIGKVFHVCLGFQEPDEDIQEVRAENAFICFSQAIDNNATHDEALARLMILLIKYQRHLLNKVTEACSNGRCNPYDFFSILNDGLPMDIPMATNTKMLITAYYLYNEINDKENIINKFEIYDEAQTYLETQNHILFHIQTLDNITDERKNELGSIVFNRIIARLRKDIELYSQHIN